MAETDFHYGGHDLESMLNAHNYYAWISDKIAGHVGNEVVEVGAGSGSFSNYLIGHKPKRLVLIEPSSDMFKHLKAASKSLGKKSPRSQIDLHNGTFSDVKKKIQGNPDTFVYINVMEHIEDDQAELDQVYSALRPGGKLIIFVPALQQLLGSFDNQVGHFRRYSKKDLVQKGEKAGFIIDQAHYMDFAGIAPWWLSFKVLKRKKLNPHVVRIYDNFAVPVIRSVERVVKPPVGKNLFLVAVKPK